MQKENFIVEENEIDDYTKNSSWNIKGETYNYIDSFRTNGDGEWTQVIVQRESDKKYFSFSWGYSTIKNIYEKEWVEVFPKTVTTTKWI